MSPDYEEGRSARSLSDEGEFARHFPGFHPRAAQQAMAAEVEKAIANQSVLIAESGTGTGKTFAYLVPALLSGGRIIVSTGTKHLQDQLFLKDLPAVRDVLGAPARVERLKGRSNYLCLHKLDLADGLLFNERRDVADLARIRDWAKKTASGDISEVAEIADDAPVWGSVTTAADACLGSRCDYLSDCFVYKARRRGMSADILVVNHHLFFSDIALKDEGTGEVLPDHDCVIFDEAHLVPDIAAQFFGFSFSSAQLKNLCRDIAVAEAADGSGVSLDEPIRDVERAGNELVLAIGTRERGELREIWANDAFRLARDRVSAALAALNESLEVAADAGENLSMAHQRCQVMIKTLDQFACDPDADMVMWYESAKRSLRLQATPVTVANLLRERLFGEPSSLVFTSATLCSDSDGTLFRKTMGIDEAEVRIWHSPYDFRARSLLYVPEGMPEPARGEFASAMLERILPVLRASQGRAFVLFTSYRMMHELYEALEANGEFPLFLQGSAPKQALIESFKSATRGVLLGTTSFWEGVDVKGRDLVCVIIDKLPFASPGDPVNQARLRHVEESGQNAFRDYLLPRAVLALKQGAGRLIRDEQDFGVLMICDPRIVDRDYGRAFIDALPPMRRTRKIELVQRFFQHFDSQDQPA